MGWGGGVGSSGDRLCQTSLIPRSPDGDKNRANILKEIHLYFNFKEHSSMACACLALDV